MERIVDESGMTARRRPPDLRQVAMSVGAALLTLAAAAGVLWLAPADQDGEGVTARTSPDLATLSPAEARLRADELTIWALERVYRAFEAEDEGEIFDALSEATAGTALEALYLQRRAALMDRGLEKTGQQIHELELLSNSVRRKDDRLIVSARWRVLGLVGHEQHRHVRGNAYTADMEFDLVDGRWRITVFTMHEVDRTDAGVVVESFATQGGETAAEK